MITTGLDHLAENGFKSLLGQRVGVISNPSGVDRRYRHLVDLLHAHGVPVKGIFGPEHGFRGSAQDGASEGTATDPRTGITVFDAYGADEEKWAQMFADSSAEVIVFDIQDAGARFYTYIWTLYDAMSAAAKLGLRFIVLERPNPCGGKASGPVMQPGFETFVGRKAIAQQHGMTTGELAGFYNGEFLPRELDLEVVPCLGWEREMTGRLEGVPWVAPSPNLPTPETALVYPGTCLFEGTNLSEGRGSTRPFELIGAPFLDYRWADGLDVSGVDFREAYFVPVLSKFSGESCAGVEVKPRNGFDAIKTAVAMLIGARKYEGFAWKEQWIDKLSGSSRLRNMVDAGADETEITESWSDELTAFELRRQPYLRHP